MGQAAKWQGVRFKRRGFGLEWAQWTQVGPLRVIRFARGYGFHRELVGKYIVLLAAGYAPLRTRCRHVEDFVVAEGTVPKAVGYIKACPYDTVAVAVGDPDALRLLTANITAWCDGCSAVMVPVELQGCEEVAVRRYHSVLEPGARVPEFHLYTDCPQPQGAT